MMLETAATPAAAAPGESRPARRAWVAVTIVVLLAIAIRFAYLWTVPWRGNDLTIVDPDGYVVSGQMLATRHFAASALYRSVAVFQFVKPPLYTVALALVSKLPGTYPVNAAVLQTVVGGAMTLAMFWIGWRVHSAAAGILAALFGAVYWPFATSGNVFFQEALYIPLLVLAFALLLEASARRGSPWLWSVAGAAFGLAALTRSMPVYYLAPALVWHVWRSGERRTAARQAGACLLAFAIVVAPYSIGISRHVHQLVVVENMGGISFPMRYPDARNAVHHTAPPPTVMETAGMLVRTFAAHPLRFASERLGDALFLVRPRDGRTLQTLDGVRTADEARLYKRVLLTFDDGLFAVVCILAPFGWALARHRRESGFVALWILLNVVLLAALAFTSARYRTPSVPFAMVFAGVALAGGWKSASRVAIAIAAVVAAAIAWEIADAVPSVLAGNPEYGIERQQDDGVTRRVDAVGGAGLNVFTPGGTVAATLQVPRDLAPSEAPARVEVRVDGQILGSWTMAAGETRTVRYVWSRPTFPYLEVRMTGGSGRPVPFVVEVPMLVPEHTH